MFVWKYELEEERAFGTFFHTLSPLRVAVLELLLQRMQIA